MLATAAPSPLHRLWRYTRPHRASVVRAVVISFLNKLFDLAPPFLIGVAVDTVVEQGASLLARFFGVQDVLLQLWVLAGLTLLVWGLESLTN